MSAQNNRVQLSQDDALHHKPAEFQEAPGEAEADAVRDAFLRGAGRTPPVSARRSAAPIASPECGLSAASNRSRATRSSSG